MKLLLTGANGFVGSYFLNIYKDTYTIETFSFVKDDFKSLQVTSTDTVIHLSALVHQMRGASDEAYEKVNVNQTLELARKAKEAGVKQFIFMSTVKVYGEESNDIYTEVSACNPQDEYGKSKLKAERELKKLADEHFIVSIIRTPIVYGKGVKANMKNLVKLIDKIPILPFGKIKNQRSFVYVGNLCAMIDCIIQTQKSGIFLAADDEMLSTTQLIELLAQVKDKKIYLLHVRLFECVLKWLKPSIFQRLFGNLMVDNEQTKAILHFKNPYTAEEGIRCMIHGEKQ